jgi:hypothetical protein
VLDRQLTRLINESSRRARGDNPLPWVIIGVAAYFMRTSLRHEERVERVTIREGHEVTVALRDRDD